MIQCLSAAMGLGLSTWMLGIYAQAARSSGSSCHSSAGCGLVRRAAESTLGGGALCIPALGVLAFSLLLATQLRLAGSAGQQIYRLLACAVGLASLGLVTLQSSIGAFCPLCLGVNLAGLLVGILGMITTTAPPWTCSRPACHTAALVITSCLAGAMAHAATLLPPSWVKDLQDEKPTIIVLLSIRCPHCRDQIQELMQASRERAHLSIIVRLIADEQESAFVTACDCADAQSKAPEFLAKLVAAPSGISLASAVKQIGLRVDEFSACFNSNLSRYQARATWQDSLEVASLPQTYFDGQQYEGLWAASEIPDLFRQLSPWRRTLELLGWAVLMASMATIVAKVVVPARPNS